jgi:hypothetical protein
MPVQNAEMAIAGVGVAGVVITFVGGLTYLYRRKTRKLRCMRRDLELAAVESREHHAK